MPLEALSELERVVERWRKLPLDRALSRSGRVRTLVQTLADRVAVANGIAPSPVPDFGPATLMDQLAVMVHDVSTQATEVSGDSSAAVPGSAGTGAALTAGLAEDLARLRRELS